MKTCFRTIQMTEEKDLGPEETTVWCPVSHQARGVAFTWSRVPVLILTCLSAP